MAKMIQIFLGLIKLQNKDKTYKRIKFKCKQNKSKTSVMIKNEIFSLIYIAKVLFSPDHCKFP